MVEDGKTGYVVETKKPEKLTEMIVRYFMNSMETEFCNTIQKESYRFRGIKLYK
ncbi:MAG: hypothetical protein J6A04_05180 [Clostridia bacterium]|nr:hypothetical protein [Clostridia bacterium]